MKHVIHESEINPTHMPGNIEKILIGPDEELGCDSMQFGTIIYPPCSKTASHVHHNKDKIVYILSGYGEVYINGIPEKIEKGSCVLVHKNKRHAIKNDSNVSMKIVYVVSPAVNVGDVHHDKFYIDKF